ncbi:MAG TPA: TetR/AcrR family transcriptional regulator [Candidatus Krumholzibacteria bacterium]|nr:TetR/AcrR family transcriptional regulator [Candidatus Krumholzibacteria bacterium]HPD70306.1 TetR/AcrR family transcriptional regulator [Candidatus Krumholzibacteria bacterium]HRY39994.1 TetR/AcrR family transcriptional regulator [Candidatus Krumholzibacteria bacterium]
MANPTADPTPAISAGTPAWNLLPDPKQRQILDAAVAEFAARGYSRASMNTLVKAAGISKGSLFHYFRSKSDLFAGLVEAAYDQAKSRVREVRDTTDGQPLPRRLERLLETGIDFISAHPRLARIYFHLLRSGDAPFGQRQLEELRRHSRRFLQELIERAQADGEVDRELDAERTAWLIDAMMERLLAAWHEEHDRGPAALEDRRAWIAAFRTFVERGLAPSTREADRG